MMIRGDNSGADNTYVWRHGGQTHAAITPAGIIALMRAAGVAPAINPEAITFLLHNSLVPAPMSVLKDVYALGVGDYAVFGDDARTELELGCDYPYYPEATPGSSVPSTRMLLDLLCAAVTRKTQGEAVLMLSSGKDSVALALALKECGLAHKIPAYTYADAASGYADEGRDAGAIAAKLGIAHNIIEVPDNPLAVKEALEHFFTHASYPSCDPTTIPYAIGLYHEGIRGVGIMDGTRSDMSMGMFPSASYERLCRYYRLIGGGCRGLDALRACIPFHSKMTKFFSSYPEVNLYRHGHFRVWETQKFYDAAFDTAPYWLGVYDAQKNKSLADGYTYINDQYFAGCGILPKIKMVAESLGCAAIMPWADQAIASYCNNLPVSEKYDLGTKINKLLLRRMLKEYMGYDADAYGKRIFYFNMAKFVQQNIKFVRDEITGCRLWNRNIGVEFDRYAAMLGSHPRAGGALVDLFMISGWHNHSKYLKE